MKMLMIVFRESMEEDIRSLLRTHHVGAFTEMHDVTGIGEAGAAFPVLCLPFGSVKSSIYSGLCGPARNRRRLQ